MAGISEYIVIIAKSSGESRVKRRGMHDWHAAATYWDSGERCFYGGELGERWLTWEIPFSVGEPL
jgi:hypothetical protein